MVSIKEGVVFCLLLRSNLFFSYKKRQSVPPDSSDSFIAGKALKRKTENL